MRDHRVAVVNLTDFLLARIADDEGAAQGETVMNDADRARYGWPPIGRNGGSTLWVDSDRCSIVVSNERVLAECEAKRRLVALHRPWGFEYGGGEGCQRCVSPDDYTVTALPDVERFPCETLVLLALPYADHEDFPEEWRPA